MFGAVRIPKRTCERANEEAAKLDGQVANLWDKQGTLGGTRPDAAGAHTRRIQPEMRFTQNDTNIATDESIDRLHVSAQVEWPSHERATQANDKRKG